jgi:hypothetical protein
MKLDPIGVVAEIIDQPAGIAGHEFVDADGRSCESGGNESTEYEEIKQTVKLHKAKVLPQR